MYSPSSAVSISTMTFGAASMIPAGTSACISELCAPWYPAALIAMGQTILAATSPQSMVRTHFGEFLIIRLMISAADTEMPANVAAVRPNINISFNVSPSFVIAFFRSPGGSVYTIAHEKKFIKLFYKK